MKWTNLFLIFVSVFSALFTSAQDKLFDSDLPIVFVNTNGSEIPDEPKITAELGIVWNQNGEQNNTHDKYNHFTGKIGIEIRGSSSQMFPKKSFGFELRNEENEGVDFPLLGMPEEEDWILYAPYSDKTLIRNVLTFSLAAKLGAYTPKCRFVELFINNKYWGVYVLMEKIKRDKNRVDISKLKNDEISGEDVTGGYIVKIDKTTGSGGDGWYSGFKNTNGTSTFYQFEYPKQEDIVEPQKEYIKNYIGEFETAVLNKNFDSTTGYSSYINQQSFYDFIVMNELSKNVDGYRLSTFLFKDKNGRLNAGPIWDFNLGFGNANYYNGWETSGLQMYADLEQDNWQIPFWWKSLLNDSYFSNSLRCNWDELREDKFSNEKVNDMVDSLVNLLAYPSIRNFSRWQVIGEYVWPNYFVGTTYVKEIEWLKSWITNRLRWLDFAMPGDCSQITGNELSAFERTVKVFPNPVSDKLNVQINASASSMYSVQLFSASGQLVTKHNYSLVTGNNLIEINTENLNSGIFICHVYQGNKKVSVHKIVKY
jgi:hypothetical protein